MSTSAVQIQQNRAAKLARRFAKRILQYHIPIGGLNRPAFAALYRLHVAACVGAAWTARLLWYEPLFRSQCRQVGERFVMERLPYVVGRGEIMIGNDVRFSGKPSFTFSSRHSQTPSLSIGDHCFLGHNSAITVAHQVKIGKHCLIAGGVRISDFDGHPLDAGQRRAGLTSPPECIAPVTIGDDVWLGHGAIVLKGVHIGDRAVIGARSVITRDVEADTVVAGNPARVIKSLQQTCDER